MQIQANKKKYKKTLDKKPVLTYNLFRQDKEMIGEKIKKYRTRLMHRNIHDRIIPMTQQMLADELRCSLVKVKHYEQNIRTPTLRGIIKLCNILGVTPNDLIDGARLSKLKIFDISSIKPSENPRESFLGGKTEVL
jgi:DNA-binding Xre family transcriptional regulator